ncbi:hypothetical protein [Kitasatospora aureofaciens]|uniref:hypothetical protein n=1 Tax=Kitasatospora aureofaciens TaxID=1894 RepID=UPI001C46EFB7|nr:hypothetical protein [Kitasatospora aureofaciens]MBV6702607.1 hypothetical protein [Kitasatospora aureofaciens]
MSVHLPVIRPALPVLPAALRPGRVVILVVVEILLVAMVSTGWSLEHAVEVLTAGTVLAGTFAAWL